MENDKPQSAPYTMEDALREAREHVNQVCDSYEAAAQAHWERQQAVEKWKTNRQNARKSTGPRTAAGKAASSKNRLSHGLCSSSLLVFGETQEEFDALRRQTHETFQPATPEEHFLTDQLTESIWRLNRARRVENAAYDVAMELTDFDLSDAGANYTDQATAPQLAKCFFDDGHRAAFASLQRYIGAAERTYRQSLKALQEAIQRRPQPVVQPPSFEPKPKAAAAGQSFPRESGFESSFPVSQSVAKPAIVDLC